MGFNNEEYMNYQCLNCCETISDKKGTKRKFCNNKCQQEYQYKISLEKYLNDQESCKAIHSSCGAVRKYILDLFNHKCSVCGWAEVNPFTKKVPLEIEHIDGNSSNNKIENLTVLCPNCHSLTKTYKGANRGNGREHRRRRYENEKKGIYITVKPKKI